MEESNENDPLLGAGSEPESREGQLSNRWKLKYTVEIPLFVTLFGISLSGAPISNLNMYRTCINSLNYSAEECYSFLEPDRINHTQELEKEVQKYVTLVNTVTSVLGALMSAVLSLFLGVWSGKHGRRPLLLWTLFGLTLSGMVTVVYSLIEQLGPWWYVLCTLPFALTGGYNILMIGANCFISDVTAESNRSFRLMLVQLTFSISQAAGSMLSPYVFKSFGIVYLLFLVATLYTFGYVFTIVFIEESLTNVDRENYYKVLEFSHLKEMIQSSFERKPNYGRAILFLTVASLAFSVFTVYGTYGLLYLFTRKHLGWTLKDYTTFASTSKAMWFVGCYVGVAFFQKALRINDLSFAAISYFSCALEYIIKMNAKTTWVMYLGSAVSIFGTVYGPLTKSFLSKTLPSQDIAKAFGLVAFSESFSPLLSPLVYNALYEFTISTFPGAFLVLTAAIYLISFICILIIKCLVNRRPSETYQAINPDPDLDSNNGIIN